MKPGIKPPCDDCRSRKIKCDRGNLCNSCNSCNLSCTYRSDRLSKAIIANEDTSLREPRKTEPELDIFSDEIIHECLKSFFENFYIQMPVFDLRRINTELLFTQQNDNIKALLASVCAFVMLQPQATMPTSDYYNLDTTPGNRMLLRALQLRKSHKDFDSMNFDTLATNFFICKSYDILGQVDQAWFYLREATTMIFIPGMDNEYAYYRVPRDNSEPWRWIKLCWLFYDMERFYAPAWRQPYTLYPTVDWPINAVEPGVSAQWATQVFV
ncbi:hypothetical protein LY76DRAFT_609907 [Colletotrichum caudatum]|nr:hypothetical protein LY76DRAFT_609907 [Colletotrichum caudatum]